MKLRTRLDRKRLILFALFGALLFALQIALSGLPNIELVTLFVILLTTVYGMQALIPIYIFVILEGIYWGFGLWWIGYLYVWALLSVVVYLLRKYSHPVLWAVVGGFFGLSFGTLFSPIYFIIGGWSGGIGWIISGLSMDIVHCLGNVASVLLLFAPLQKVMLSKAL